MNINRYKNKIFTIPNILSFFRICLIPFIIYFYLYKENVSLTVMILVISGCTDVIDGYIARKFHMISDLGKILDPIADKLTQLVMMICLVMHFPLISIPLSLLVLKEFLVGITGILVINKTGKVLGANWHGKLATVFLDIMMIVHVAWYDIPEYYSEWMIWICVVAMGVSLILYVLRNMRMMKIMNG